MASPQAHPEPKEGLCEGPVRATLSGVNGFPWKQKGRHSNIDFVNWLFCAVSWPNQAMGVSETSLAWFFPLAKRFQSFKLLTLRPILAHFRRKVSRPRGVALDAAGLERDTPRPWATAVRLSSATPLPRGHSTNTPCD